MSLFNIFKKEDKKEDALEAVLNDEARVEEIGKDDKGENILGHNKEFYQGCELGAFLCVTEWLKRIIETNKPIFKDDTERFVNRIDEYIEKYSSDEYKDVTTYEKCRNIVKELMESPNLQSFDSAHIVLNKINQEMVHTFGWEEKEKQELSEFQKSCKYHNQEGTVDFGSSSIIIDEIGESKTMDRAKEIMGKLNRMDKVSCFKDEIKAFKGQIDAFSQRLDKYINDTNII